MGEREKKIIDSMDHLSLNHLYFDLIQSIMIANPRGSKQKIKENEKVNYIKERLNNLKNEYQGV
jgi:hypothetical protein